MRLRRSVKRYWRFPRLEIRPGFYIYMCFLVLVVPWPWLIAAILAAGFHELSHAVMIRILGVPICSLLLCPGGMRLETQNMTKQQEILAAAAGPVGGLLLLPLASACPRLVICAVVQSAFNLLPLVPLDGGRVLRGALLLGLGESRGAKAYRWFKRGILMLLLGSALWRPIIFGACAVALVLTIRENST